MSVSDQLRSGGAYMRSVPKKYYALVGILAIVLAYGVIFFLPKNVVFSYAGETCTRQLTIAPSLHKSQSNDFSVNYQGSWSIAGMPVIAMKTCFKATSSPQSGSVAVRTSPFGGPLLRKSFNLAVGDAPAIVAARAEPIATTKPYTLAMTSADSIHQYDLTIANKTTDCASVKKELSCDVPDMKLDQGKEYDYTISKQFKQQPAEEVQRSTLTTLSAVKVVKSSVKNKETVYSKPKSIELTLDKTILGAKVTLQEGKNTIPTTVAADGKKLTVSIKDSLPREKSYELMIASVDAEDGSTLISPYKLNFKTSGGPMVDNVSVGQSKVERSAGIILTFDQKLAPKQDVTKLIKVEGSQAVVQKINDIQVRVQLNNAPLCKAFSIHIAKGVESNQGITSKKDWSFDSRVTCSQTSVIGYSVQGRPIVAYYFGSGGSTVLFTGGMHGEEQSGYQTMQSWVEYLDINAHKLPAGRQVVVVPNTNPDGIAANQRYNANNVNLHRNSPSQDWQPSADTPQGKEPFAGGKSPASEPETKALVALTRQLNPRLEVSFHAQGSFVGANQFGDAKTVGARYAQMVGYRTIFSGVEETLGYAIFGEYEEWMGEIGIPAIVVELPTRNGSYFASHQAALLSMTNL